MRLTEYVCISACWLLYVCVLCFVTADAAPCCVLGRKEPSRSDVASSWPRCPRA
jgi:hypothetical protein